MRSGAFDRGGAEPVAGTERGGPEAGFGIEREAGCRTGETAGGPASGRIADRAPPADGSPGSDRKDRSRINKDHRRAGWRERRLSPLQGHVEKGLRKKPGAEGVVNPKSACDSAVSVCDSVSPAGALSLTT